MLAATAVGALVLTAGPFGAARADAAVAVPLGGAADYAVLGATPSITNVGASVITGDIGISPASSIVGFGSATVTGTQHANDQDAIDAQTDLTVAYLQAQAQTPSTTIPSQLGGTAPVPGAYTDGPGGGGLDLTGVLTLDGGGSYDSIWVFQSESSLVTAGDVVLSNGAQACNVYWQVTSSATLGTSTDFAGTIMALASITTVSGVTVQGRLLARSAAVTIDNTTITRPDTCLTGPVVPVVVPPAVPAVPGGPGGGVGEAGSGALLARTGTDPWPSILWAAGLISAGLGALAVGRIRDRRSSHRAS